MLLDLCHVPFHFNWNIFRYMPYRALLSDMDSYYTLNTISHHLHSICFTLVSLTHFHNAFIRKLIMSMENGNIPYRQCALMGYVRAEKCAYNLQLNSLLISLFTAYFLVNTIVAGLIDTFADGIIKNLFCPRCNKLSMLLNCFRSHTHEYIPSPFPSSSLICMQSSHIYRIYADL